MSRKKSTSEEVAALLSEVNKLKGDLLKSKLPSGQTPAARKFKLDQKQARVDLVAAKDTVAIAGTLAMISDQIGLQSCDLDTSALRGALLLIQDKCEDPQEIAKFLARNEQFQLGKRRAVTGLKTFVAAAKPSAALIAKAQELELKRNELSGGFSGRASLEALVALGRDFTCTVRVSYSRKQVELVTDGKVDASVEAELAKATKGNVAGDPPVQTPATDKGETDPCVDADESADAALEVSPSPVTPTAAAVAQNLRSTFGSKAPPSSSAVLGSEQGG